MLSKVSQNLPLWIERFLAIDSFNSNQYILALEPNTVIEMLKKRAEATYRLYFYQDTKNETRAVLLYKFGRNSFRRRMSLRIHEHEKGTKIYAEYKLSSISIVLIIFFWVVTLLMTGMYACMVLSSAIFPQEGTSSSSNISTLFTPIGVLFLFFQLARGFAHLETSKTKEHFISTFRGYIIDSEGVLG